jgi:hypothetical protein
MGKMKTPIRCILFVCLSLVECSNSSLDREEATVYATYINQNFVSESIGQINHTFQNIILFNTTIANNPDHSWASYLKDMPSKPDKETIEHFLSRNATPHPLNVHLGFKIGHILLSDDEFQSQFGSPTDFKKLFDKYDCHGIVSLSKVGFNHDRTQALVYVGNEVDDLAGCGLLVLFEKSHGIWRQLCKKETWVS